MTLPSLPARRPRTSSSLGSTPTASWLSRPLIGGAGGDFQDTSARSCVLRTEEMPILGKCSRKSRHGFSLTSVAGARHPREVAESLPLPVFFHSITMNGWSITAGSMPLMYTCSGSPAQNFNLLTTGQIEVGASGLCVSSTGTNQQYQSILVGIHSFRST